MENLLEELKVWLKQTKEQNPTSEWSTGIRLGKVLMLEKVINELEEMQKDNK